MYENCRKEEMLVRSAHRIRPVVWTGVLAAVLVSGCSIFAPAPPSHQGNVCEIFRENPKWYDYARASEQKWGTPIATQMAFIQHESGFRSHIRPPRKKFLGFIPTFRPSSAYGYAQAQDPVWGEYKADAGGWMSSRSDMKDATDFVGWYNRQTQRQVGISLHNTEHLYLAYHEGAGGYRSGSWKRKPAVRRSARAVSATASAYDRQLAQCEAEFQCRRFWQLRPFCSG